MWLHWIAIHGSNDTIHLLGMGHSVAKKLGNNIREHIIACADKLVKSRRMLQRSSHRQEKGLGLDPS